MVLFVDNTSIIITDTNKLNFKMNLNQTQFGQLGDTALEET
jgi:hypothetical protein